MPRDRSRPGAEVSRMRLSQGRMLSRRLGLFCCPCSVGVRIDLEQRQRFSQLLTLGKSRGPVAVVAVTVEAQTLAGEQAARDHGDGHF